jgi:hypothetical protein
MKLREKTSVHGKRAHTSFHEDSLNVEKLHGYVTLTQKTETDFAQLLHSSFFGLFTYYISALGGSRSTDS